LCTAVAKEVGCMVWVVLSHTLNPSAIFFTAVAFRYMAGQLASG